MYRVFYNNTLIADSRIEDLAIINPVVSLKVNCAGTFTFTMPSNHPYYDLIQKKVGLIKVFRDEEQIFEGDCVRTTVDFFKQKKIECEGDLAFLNDTFLRPGRVEDLTSRQLLERYIASHNALVSEEKRFTVGQVTAHDSNDSISCYTNYNSTMTEIKEDLIDDIGGFLRVRHENNIRYLDYLASSPRTNSQIIRLGENLIDLSIGLDTEELATVIIPLGETLGTQSIPGLDERLTIKTAAADSMHPAGTDYVYSQAAVSSFGWIEKVIEWNDVTEVSNLLSKGKKYLQETQFENLVIKAKAIDLGITSEELQKFRLLDMIRIISEPHGLDRYFMLSEMKINLNNPEQDTVTLGIEEFNSLTAKSSSANAAIMKQIEQMPTSNAVKSAIDNATALITGAEGGYVVIERNSSGQPIEIKIQDALNNPTKIWRWNQNGFGYSNDGGQTYGLAMTMNGAIVADYITSGTMYADRIKGGTLTLGGASNTNGQLIVKDASSHTVGQWNKDGIKLYRGTVGGWYISNSAITSYNGTSDADSTRKVVMYKYVNSDDNWAFAVYTRNSTSDSWVGKFAVNYAGNIVSQSSVDFYPTDDTYGVAVHGKLYGYGDINAEGGLYVNYNVYADGNVSGSVTDGRAGLNCTGGGLYVYGNIYADGGIGCGGTKSRIVETDNYGYRTMNAYETPSPYFGDIGEGILNEDGECIVYLDDVYLECVDLENKYQVFLQKYGQGDIWVEQREYNYFVVKGTANLRFGWEIKAIQKNYDSVRLDTPNEKMLATIIEQQAQEG